MVVVREPEEQGKENRRWCQAYGKLNKDKNKKWEEQEVGLTGVRKLVEKRRKEKL